MHNSFQGDIMDASTLHILFTFIGTLAILFIPYYFFIKFPLLKS